jgi:ABC-type branched-subunit amino acid transport system permease subunit
VSGHEVWHVVVLASTLFGGAGALILVLGPLVFDSPAHRPPWARPLVVGLILLAVGVFLAEWLVVH